MWLLLPALLLKRILNSTSLAQESADIPADPPFVTIVIPARNEGANIERCVRSMLASTYPSFQVVVVDDFSTDDTAAIVERIAAEDSRVRLIPGTPVPDGWIGGQWALLTGAKQTGGEIICFADADTWHKSELLARSVNAMTRAGADILSVSCKQVLASPWERILQPQVLLLLAARYGGTEHITRSRKESGKFAGGPCILVRRDAYESVGGHGVAKGYIAQDVMLARGFFRNGKRLVVTDSGGHAFVRMYNSLSAMIAGWSKNIIRGTRISAGKSGVPDAAKNFALLMIPVFQLLPEVLLLAGIVSGNAALAVFGALSMAALLLFWILIYRLLGEGGLWGLAFPGGAAMLLYILLLSMQRGDRFEWKGRAYRSR